MDCTTDSWLLKIDPVSVTWHSSKGVKQESHEIVSAILKDVEGMNSSAITTNSSYFYSKLIARAASPDWYEDAELASIANVASTLTSLEILSAKMCLYVPIQENNESLISSIFSYICPTSVAYKHGEDTLSINW
ncbi:glycoside hydrolase family 81 protein [Medicago truncatula]|uniref:Glycoside hydrolase family 81 protein n=1 Tax=Medicago truncatula TaxID=3880 RepID=A0A072U703_MEDTR|nr:glycoside hydrolase family 81 protein [Medicago truncatula]